MQVLRTGKHTAQTVLGTVVEGDQLAEGGRLQLVGFINNQYRVITGHTVEIFRYHLQQGRNIGIASLGYTAGAFGQLNEELPGVPLLCLDEDNRAGEILVEEVFQGLCLAASRLIRDRHPQSLLLTGAVNKLDLTVVLDGGHHLPAVFLIA